jgi:hypothetical protein
MIAIAIASLIDFPNAIAMGSGANEETKTRVRAARPGSGSQVAHGHFTFYITFPLHVHDVLRTGAGVYMYISESMGRKRRFQIRKPHIVHVWIDIHTHTTHTFLLFPFFFLRRSRHLFCFCSS